MYLKRGISYFPLHDFSEFINNNKATKVKYNKNRYIYNFNPLEYFREKQ